MVEAHVVDAWTREADRHGSGYAYAVFIAGLAAPLFLFLAGLALAMSASARAAAGGHRSAGRHALIRGAQVFGLAFLFRLQSQLLGWGPLVNFLKVDVLNVMGVAMIAAALVWGLIESRPARFAAFAVLTTIVTMSTPLIREMSSLAMLPYPIEGYLRPIPGRSTFAIFPWAGFVFAGVIAGDLVAIWRTRASDRGLQAGFLIAGIAAIAGGYWASLQPSIYPVANFWTSSPTFFFIRLGICIALLPVAWLIATRPRMVNVLGRSSLFVYWIHVEMVYGVLGRPLRLLMPLPVAITAWAILCVALYAIVMWKNRVMEGVKLNGAVQIFAPVLK